MGIGQAISSICYTHISVFVLFLFGVLQAGTNGYMAPEILMEKVSYSYPVDWFAMGCSIYEMVAGRTPFKDYKEKVSKEDLKQRTLKEDVQFQHDNFTEEAKDICRLFLAKKPEQRLGSR